MFILSHKKYGEYEDFEVSSESSPNTSYLVTAHALTSDTGKTT